MFATKSKFSLFAQHMFLSLLGMILLGTACLAGNLSPEAIQAKQKCIRAKLMVSQGKTDDSIAVLQSQQSVVEENIGGYAEYRLCECLRSKQQYQESIALAQSIVEKYKTVDPILAGWAELSIAANLHEIGHTTKDYSEAIKVLRSVAIRYANLDDLGPAIQARNELGELFQQHFTYDVSELNAVKQILIEDQHALTWVRGICSMQKALWGEDKNSARDEYTALPINNREKALYGFEIACSEIECYVRGRSFEKEVLNHAIAFGAELCQLYPDQHYLKAKYRLDLARYYSSKDKNDDAEKLIRTAMTEDPIPSFMPTAYYELASSQMAKKNYNGAITTLQDLRRLYIGSDYDDAALGKICTAQLLSSNKADAASTLKELQEKYPESNWLQVIAGYSKVLNADESNR